MKPIAAASLISLLMLIGVANAACDKQSAKETLKKMTDPRMASIIEEDGWTVVRFGTDYASWTSSQLDTLITAYANVDACIHGNARKMEFRSPSGKVIARANPSRGIQMY
jgi:hypothetical protein